MRWTHANNCTTDARALIAGTSEFKDGVNQDRRLCDLILQRRLVYQALGELLGHLSSQVVGLRAEKQNVAAQPIHALQEGSETDISR
jgi:hypothetical protein